jgi:hypothetical protein
VGVSRFHFFISISAYALPVEVEEIMLAFHVYELPVERFHVAQSLLATSWFDEAYIQMVLEGIQPGRIFVDDPEHPMAVLLCHPYEFYVVGEVVPALRQFIKDAPTEVDIFHTLYGYCAASKAWEQAILDDRAGELLCIPRRNFKFSETILLDWRSSLPASATVRAVDYQIAAQIDAVPWKPITHYWGSYQNFLDKSFGYGLFIGDTLASLCYAGAISHQYVNFNVDTAEPYRRQGLATLVSAAAIEECLKRKLIPTWDTDGSNLASTALAIKLGFQEFEPFSQLSPAPNKKLILSQGLWQSNTNDTVWVKAGS